MKFQSRNRETFDSNFSVDGFNASTKSNLFQSRNRETFDSNHPICHQTHPSLYLYWFQSRNRETFDSNYRHSH